MWFFCWWRGGGEGPGGGVLDSVLVPQLHQDPPQSRDDRARWSNEKKNYSIWKTGDENTGKENIHHPGKKSNKNKTKSFTSKTI